MSQTNDVIEELQRSVYAQRLRVTQLQRLVYAQKQPSTDPAQVEPLFQAQAALYASERQLAEVQRQVEAVATQPTQVAERPPEQPVKRDGMRTYQPETMRQATTRSSPHRGLDTTGLQVAVRLQMAQVPTALYHLFDATEKPLLECVVSTQSSQKRRLRIISYIEGYSAQAVNTIELAAQDGPRTICQLPTLFPDRVHTVRELTRATLNVLAEDLENKQIEEHQSHPLWLLARNAAPLAVKNPTTKQWDDLSRYYGAFVTPNQVDVMAFLREAVDRHVFQQLVGYQAGEPVTPQVEAVYTALKEKAQLTYINSLVAFNPDEGAKTQRVRLPRETLKERAANCMDGVLLFASLLEAISLNPALVILPKHALIGWQIAPDSDQWAYLETTLLNECDFATALAHGNRLARQYAAEQTKADAAGRHNEGWFRRWALSELRTKYGITPLE